jgi:hypothetical protein
MMNSRQTERIMMQTCKIGAVVGLLFQPTTVIAFQVFSNQLTFQGAIGASTIIDFQNFPLSANGFGAFGNNHEIGQATFNSLSVLSNIDLFDIFGNDTNLNGTFLVGSGGAVSNAFVRPGGQGPFGVPGLETDDDFSVVFATPVQAAGILILDNTPETNEFVQFRAANNSLIAVVALPDNDGFVGLLTQAGDSLIRSIQILEGSGSDDIAFDNVIFAVPEPSILFLVGGPIAPIVVCGRRRLTV